MGSQQSATTVTTKSGEIQRIPLESGLQPTDISNEGPETLFEKDEAFVLLQKTARNTEKRELDELTEFEAHGFSFFLPEKKLQRYKEDRQNVGDKVATIGSQEEIFLSSSPGADTGLFASVLAAYNHHWALRTSPDDWWFCVIKKVAKAIDDNSSKDAVRKFFVDHEGKKTLKIEVDTPSIYGIDYSWFFDEMSKLISENVKVPGYVDAVSGNFSTTTAVQRIVSQITLMSSVQEFFDFKMKIQCGIPVVEMLGSEEDWEQLLTKAEVLRKLLKPIRADIGLTEEWWATVESVFKNLLATYRGKPDKKWWSHVMSWKTAFMSGEVSGWEGWIVDFLEGPATRMEESTFSSGLVTVPLKLVGPSGVEDIAVLVAGMLGFTVHQDVADRPSVQPFQGWSLLLPENSPFRCAKED